MLDLKAFDQDAHKIAESLKKRGGGAGLKQAIDAVIAKNAERKKVILAVEALKNRRNSASAEIAKLKKAGQDANALLEEMKQVALDIKKLDEQQAGVEAELKTLLMEIPNTPHESVPAGGGPEQNVEIRRWGEPKKLAFKPLTHDEIGEKLGIIDFKKAGEVTGARFVFLKGLAAKLERALGQLMIDTHGTRGYEEIQPPFLVNRNALIGTGQLPKFEEDVFRIEKFDYFLIPTAEVSVTNYHRDEILDEKALPKKYVALTPCFRSEAGSYGKDTKGLKRQHQFNKAELVKFTTPENGFAELETLVADAENILKLLGLPYRVVLLCGGDMGFGSSKTYDIEVWSPGANAYMEISSCSCFTDFQARRTNIRYRDGKGKVHFVYTLNGSGLAVGRTLLAVIESYQQPDGTFAIPDALKPYLS